MEGKKERTKSAERTSSLKEAILSGNAGRSSFEGTWPILYHAQKRDEREKRRGPKVP